MAASPTKTLPTKVVQITVEGYNDGKYGRSVIANEQWYGKGRAYKGELLEKGKTYNLTIFENKGYLNYVKAEEVEAAGPQDQEVVTLDEHAKQITRVSTPVLKVASKGKPDVQRLIVRQNALTNAVAFENARKGLIGDVLSTLEIFAERVYEGVPQLVEVAPKELPTLDAGIPTNGVDTTEASTPGPKVDGTAYNPLMGIK